MSNIRNDRLPKKDNSGGGNHKVEGIVIGAVVGAIAGLAVSGTLGVLGVAWSAGIGMVIGYAAGYFIKK